VKSSLRVHLTREPERFIYIVKLEIEQRGKNKRPARRNRSGPEAFSEVPDYYSISM
jgi:hypothetical protein